MAERPAGDAKEDLQSQDANRRALMSTGLRRPDDGQ